MEPSQSIQRGRFEIVIQDARNRKRVLWASPDFELDEEARASFPRLAGAWSPDARFLAFSRPGRAPSVLIVGTDLGKLYATLENGTHPVWSPDGSQCAFIRTHDHTNSLCVVERRGQTFTPSKQLSETGPACATPGWSGDSQSIFAVVEKSTARSRELALDRISSKSGESARVFGLVADAALRATTVQGVPIEFDREGERCFFAPDIEGRDSELGMGMLRDQHIPKRFHPIDMGLKIGSLAISPDGRYLAIRFGSLSSLSPPALYDLGTEQITLLVPDEASKRQWLDALIGVSRHVLITALPPVTADGHVGQRPTLLPLPGELPTNEVIKLRLNRIARFALPMCIRHSSTGEDDREKRQADWFATESRLFFAYILDDYFSAASDLDALESRMTTPEERLAALSLRSQILWSQGQQSRAKSMIDYLTTVEGAATKRVEETAAGLVFTAEASPKQTWSRYLAARVAESTNPSRSRLSLPNEGIDIPQQLFAAPEPPPFEMRGGNAPFAPLFPRLDGMRNFQVAEPDQPNLLLPPQPQPPFNLNLPALRLFP
jgi:hypothetical protein